MYRHFRFATGVALCVVIGLAAAKTAEAQAGAAESAVLLVYQRFGEDDYPAANIRVDQLEAHIRMLQNGRYTVLSAAEIVEALTGGKPLPNRTVGITIDGAYRSVYDVAWPRLRAAGLPFTLFVATDPADQGLPGYLSWDEIRELRDAGVAIGAHTASQPHMGEESDSGIRAELEKSLARFEAELGQRPTLFSFPYGEASASAKRTVAEAGFAAAFGLHSGPAHPGADRYYLPRFPMTEPYGETKAFNLRIESLALPVQDLQPADPQIAGNGPIAVSFVVDPAVGRLREISCFHSRLGPLELRPTGERRFEAAIDEDGNSGIWRINCTMPTGGSRWRWFGMQYYTGAE